MPADLPGLYFDHTRNRYFPLTSRSSLPASPYSSLPASSPSYISAAVPSRARQQDSEPPNTERSQRRRIRWSANTCSPPTSAAQARFSESLLLDRIAGTRCGTSERVRWPVGEGALTAFRTATTPDPDGRVRQWIGDARGWVYSRASVSSQDTWDDDDGDERDEWSSWSPELCLHPASEISAICTSGTRAVATCFGPATKVCVQDACASGDGDADGEGDEHRRTFLLTLSTTHDVRAASLEGSALVLGAARTAVLLPDIDSASQVRRLDTGSDVFAVAQSKSLVYAGTRAGTAHRFDVRVGGKTMHTLLPLDALSAFSGSHQGSARPAPRSSITALHPTHAGPALIVGRADGRLASYDLRFLRADAAPVVSYAGHVGALAGGTRLGSALDPGERVLYAAGADGALRAWAVGSGQAVYSESTRDEMRMEVDDAPSALHSASSSGACISPARAPFAARTRFPAPLASLQALDAGDGTELWAGGGNAVYRWRVGV
ncbi:hypothetical protein B0H15DRAFT_858099 [Mycena belliarum]|uniref:WD40 repeat-like protein n=1 Tax=Mycena belliarum TaxID=1033014 RepID=A0AAD6TZT0_9AGAR|nr:hypothetical protein B0H15DRAFT_858099 [Mycena belliae]